VVDDEAPGAAQAVRADAVRVAVADHDQQVGAGRGRGHLALRPAGAGRHLNRPPEPLPRRGQQLGLGLGVQCGQLGRRVVAAPASEQPGPRPVHGVGLGRVGHVQQRDLGAGRDVRTGGVDGRLPAAVGHPDQDVHPADLARSPRPEPLSRP
jgi:hypothetical protein